MCTCSHVKQSDAQTEAAGRYRALQLQETLLVNTVHIIILILASLHNGCFVKGALDKGLPLLFPNIVYARGSLQ